MRRLGRLADGMLEAGWLAAVILLPLFIDKGRTEVFDPPKAGVLRTLALFMLAAWAIKALSSPRENAAGEAEPASKWAPVPRLLRAPLVLPAAFVLLTTLLATVLSVAPSESFWGHYGRGQGTLTTLASVAIFAATAANLTPGAQLRRLVTALILPSLPIALYAVFQRLHLEPLQITARQTEIQRATSLLGQPVFLAAYLGMVIPFTALRVVEAFRERVVPRAQRILSIGLHAGLLGLQTAAALLTESRGPLLGLMVAGAVGLLSVAARRKARRTVLAVGAIAGAGVLALALVTPIVLNSAPVGSERARIARRVADVFDSRGGGGLFRTVNWTVAERVLTSRAPFELSDGKRDEHPGLRTWVGFGPEVQYAVSTPFYPADLPFHFGYFLMDRYHHDLWDALITTGVLGLLAFLGMQTTAFYLTLRGLELVATPRRKRLFWGAHAGGAALGALVWTVWQGSPFVFLGLQVGAVAGIAVYLAGIAVWRGGDTLAPLPHQGLLTALLVAFVGHVIETSFSFTVVTTGALFWLFCGLLAVCTSARTAEQPEHARGDDVARAPTFRAALSAGLILGLTLMALGWAFLGGFSLSSKPGMVLWEALTLLSNPAWKRYPVVSIITGVTLVGGTLLLALEPRAVLGRTRARMARHAGTILAVAALVGVSYWGRLAYLLAQRGVRASGNAVIVARNVGLRSEAVTSFYVCCLLLLLLFALTRGAPLRQSLATVRPSWVWGRWAASAAIAVLAFVLVAPCALRPAVADAAVAVGRTLDNSNQMSLAEEAFRRASELEPHVDRHMGSLAKAYAKHARLDEGRADAWYQLANQAVLAAIARNPAAGEHASNLAIIRGNWAQEARGAARDALRNSVPPLYTRALHLNPQDPTLWRRWGQVQLSLLENPLSALVSAERVLARDPKNASAFALLAECQVILARGREGEARKEGFLTAASSYRRAIDLAPRVLEYRVGEGKAYLEAGEASRAVAALRTALSVTPASAPGRKSTAAVLRKAESALALVTKSEASNP